MFDRNGRTDAAMSLKISHRGLLDLEWVVPTFLLTMDFPLDLWAVLVRSVVSSEVRFVRPLRQGTTRQLRVFAVGGILSPGHEGQATHCRSPRAQGPPGSSSRHLGAPPADRFLLLALGS